jgi:hypothetical protein
MSGKNNWMVLGLMLGLVPFLRAEPLDLKQVPADAKWLAHIDFDALRASTVVQKAINKHKEMHKEAEQHLALAQTMLGMDLQKDLHGATFYGKQIGKHTGVMILNANMDQKRLLALAAMVPNRKVTKYGDLDLHAWTHKVHNREHTVAGTFFKPTLLVLASSVDELKAAVDVLGGKSTTVAGEGPLAGRFPPGTCVLFRVAGVAEANLPCKSPLVKQLESYRFVLGENDGQSFYRARAVMTSAETVGLLKTVIEGGRALALLHNRGKEQGKKLIDSLQVRAEDRTLTVLWSASASDVWEQAQLHAKIFAEHRAKMKKFGKGRPGPKFEIEFDLKIPGKKPVPTKDDDF